MERLVFLSQTWLLLLSLWFALFFHKHASLSYLACLVLSVDGFFFFVCVLLVSLSATLLFLFTLLFSVVALLQHCSIIKNVCCICTCANSRINEHFVPRPPPCPWVRDLKRRHFQRYNYTSGHLMHRTCVHCLLNIPFFFLLLLDDQEKYGSEPVPVLWPLSHMKSSLITWRWCEFARLQCFWSFFLFFFWTPLASIDINNAFIFIFLLLVSFQVCQLSFFFFHACACAYGYVDIKLFLRKRFFFSSSNRLEASATRSK